jgi:signal transduction histidine kinase/AmiR/NasT family two-component response regulator
MLNLIGANSFEQLACHAVTEFFRPEDREKALERMCMAMAGNELAAREAELLRLDGQEVAVEFHTTPIDFRGTRAIQTIVRDITRRKQAESRQELTSRILHLLNQGTDDLPALIRKALGLIRESTGFDAIGLRLRQGNDYPYYEQNGFSNEFVRNENFLCSPRPDGSIVADENERLELECMCGLVISGRTNSAMPCFTEGGSFWTNASSELLAIPIEADPRTNPRNRCIHSGYKSFALIPVRSGREIIGLLQLNDHSAGRFTLGSIRFFEGLADQIGLALKRKLVQEELKSLNETLEHRVVERTEQLRQLALELTKTEQHERQRLAQVLHDGLQQILVGAKFRLESIECTNDRKAAVSEVLDIIDDAIETSRTLTAELSPPILYQGGLLAALEWLARWMYDKHGFEVNLVARKRISPLPKDMTVLLFLAVRELLFNAIKHAGIHSAQVNVIQDYDKLLITVADQGTGFDPTKLRAAGGKAGGFGLFNLSERIKILGGTIEINSSPGGGSQIALMAPVASIKDESIPASTDKQAQVSVGILSAASSDGTAAKGKIRIILVDDHLVMRQGLAGLLRAEPDLEIVGEASDGESAITVIREIEPDVVLMDISMPRTNGVQATRIIHSELPEVRVIGLSMFEEDEQAAAMREAGAVGFVTKSGPSEVLISAIRTSIKPSKEPVAEMRETVRKKSFSA